MDLENIILSKSDKDHIISLICEIQFEKDTKQNQPYKYRKQVYVYKMVIILLGGHKLGEWDEHMHTTISNKDLLYSGRHTTQYSMITYMGQGGV